MPYFKHIGFYRQIIILLFITFWVHACGVSTTPPISQTNPETTSLASTPSTSEVQLEPTLTDLPLEATATLLAPSPTPATSSPTAQADADVIFAEARQTDFETWTFHVTVQHPDTGWDDYADGWDVLLPDDTILKPNPNDPFTRLLLHPHETEQPFTRSQSNLIIPTTVTTVTVRAHDLIHGWGGAMVIVDLTQAEGVGFKVTK